MKTFIVDVSICNGCYCCQIACKDEHVGNDWTPYAKPQPDTGHFWLKLNEYIRGTVPKVKMHYVPVLCMHCDDAPCMTACPIEGAIYKTEDGLVIIDPEKCTGCKNCVDVCPFDAVFFNEDLNIAQKCSGCAHLLNSQEWKVPRCVDACPTEALKFGEADEMHNFIAKANPLKPDIDTKSRVHYLNIPKKFIGGTLYDPVQKEVIIGASCTLWSESMQQQINTDDFGDFLFDGLSEDYYSLKIEASGFAVKVFEKIHTDKDVNLGDVPIER